MTETDKEFVTRMAMYLVEGLDKEDFDRLFALLARRGADAADEITRLRAALREIRHKRLEMDMGDLSAEEVVWEADEIARAALGGGDE